MKKLIILIFIAFFIVSGVFGSGYISKHMRQGVNMAEKNLYRGQMLLRMKAELGLTPDQVKKIEQMGLDFQGSVIKRMADTKILELKFANYLQGDKISKKTIEKMIKEIAGLKTNLQIDRIFHLLDVKGVLTPEQIKKADELKYKLGRRAFFKDRGRSPRGTDRKGDRRSGRPGLR